MLRRGVDIEHIRTQENIKFKQNAAQGAEWSESRRPIRKYRAATMRKLCCVFKELCSEIDRKTFNKQVVLKDKNLEKILVDDVFLWLDSFPGWCAKGVIASPLKGMQGNQEYLLFGEKQGQKQ